MAHKKVLDHELGHKLRKLEKNTREACMLCKNRADFKCFECYIEFCATCYREVEDPARSWVFVDKYVSKQIMCDFCNDDLAFLQDDEKMVYICLGCFEDLFY